MKLSFVLLVVCCCFIASHLAAVPATADMPFLKRIGTKIYAETEQGQKEFRSNGVNNYALGIDQNCCGKCNADKKNDTVCGITHPTKFRVADTVRTAAAFAGGGLSLMRSHTVGLSCGHPWSFEYDLGKFNASALDSADYAVHVAQQHGVYIVAPLINNWNYKFECDYHNFCDWHNVTKDCEKTFYDLSSAVSRSFFKYVEARLTHVNKYTHRRTLDEPNLLYESGNELTGAPPEWTIALGRFVKKLTKNRALFVSGTDFVSVGELVGDSPVDIVDTHFYPPNYFDLKLNADLVASFNRSYAALEFGWNYNSTNLGEWLRIGREHPAIVALLAWEIFPHCDIYGLVPHGDGFTLHFPAQPKTSPFVAARMATIRDAAFALKYGSADVRCQRKDLWFNTTIAPVLGIFPAAAGSGEAKPRIAWRGCSGATSYQVLRRKSTAKAAMASGDGDGGPWIPVARLGDDELPWVDSSAEQGQRYSYKIVPLAEQCGAVVQGIVSNIITV